MSISSVDVDVAIVGAGPTGLLAADLLARSGVRVRIVDRAPGAAKESRAFAVQARTLELLLAIGLADRFIERGLLATGARIYVDGKPSAAFDIDLSARGDTPYPVVLMLPQSEVEAILAEDLAGLGVAVERGTTAETLTQDEDGVLIEGRNEAGEAVRIAASYCIGADGAHSFVRKALGLSFEGAAYQQTFLLADCKVHGPLEHGPFAMFLHGRDFAMNFPLKGQDYGRVIAADPQGVVDQTIASQGSSPATLPEVEEAFRRASQLDIRLSEPRWLSRYRVHHRGVDRYREGRVFVAGDAAHIHSPAGGQGMNTGLQDVANLSWKLALAVRGDAPPTLLDSYHAERWPVGDRVLRMTDRAFSVATSRSGWVTALRDVMAPIVGGAMARSGALRSRVFHFISQLGIRYHPGGAVADEGEAWPAGPAPGRRAPDATIGRKTSVFDLIGGYRFTLLAFSRTALGSDEIDRLSRALQAVAAGTSVPLDTHLVAHSFAGSDPRLIQAENSAVFSAYGLDHDRPQALYLVRPDGHVAWRAPGLDIAIAGCRRFIEERFARPSAP